MICSSENLVLFISSVLLSGPDSNPTWRKIRGSRQIVDQSGKIWFLEVNPSAQFLWIEDINPEIDLLGPYLHMLAGHELGTATPRLSEVLADEEYLSFESALRETHEEAISSFKSYE